MEFEEIMITDIGLVWPNGKGNPRSKTDHIQIHHTVGCYGTPKKWAALHSSKQREGQRGVPYSFLVKQDGEVYLGRGWEYSHGAVKDALTNNANQRSIAIALDGDMRQEALPTEKQLASAQTLVRQAMARYRLPVEKVLGHNEIPVESGGTYPTACPAMDMEAFRAGLKEDTSAAEHGTVFPYYAAYGGSTYVNLRDKPSGAAVGRVSAGDRVVVLASRTTNREWVEVILLAEKPIRGWCVPDWLKREV